MNKPSPFPPKFLCRLAGLRLRQRRERIEQERDEGDRMEARKKGSSREEGHHPTATIDHRGSGGSYHRKAGKRAARAINRGEVGQ